MQLTNSWISGFVDSEGCFNIQKIKKKTSIVVLRHRFIVSQDKRSVSVLYALKQSFKCGTVHKAGGNMMFFQVSKIAHLQTIIIPFFQKYTLKTFKSEDFRLFVESLENYVSSHQKIHIIEKHTENQKFSIDMGKNEILDYISKNDSAKHSETFIPAFTYNLSDGWFRGFIDAEGCFFVSLVKDYPRPQLIIGLQSKEKPLLIELQKFLKCGTLRTGKDNTEILQIVSSRDLERYIFPKLQTKGGAVLLKTSNRLSYQKFRKIVRLVVEKKQYTIEGLEKIKILKNGLNKQNKENNNVFQDIQNSCIPYYT